MKIKFTNSKIAAISSVVGNKCINIDDEKEYYNNEKQLARLKKAIGFNTRYVVDNETTTYDLCKTAFEQILYNSKYTPSDFDAIISVTQTPDYKMPGNAHLLHGEYNFAKDCIALDLELGCSGYIYGLFESFLLCDKGFKRILLLNGDTLSKIINIKNRIDAPIFGDCGCATVIEHSDNTNESFFILKSDGTGSKMMYQKAGGFRNISCQETKKITIDNNGNEFCDEDFYMSGADVFTFSLTEQPELIENLLNFSDKNINDIDYFILHQANKFIVDSIATKAKLPKEKVPYMNFVNYGNQSGASICATICAEMQGKIENKNILLQGFGIGLSWGGCILKTDKNLKIIPTKIYKGI